MITATEREARRQRSIERTRERDAALKDGRCTRCLGRGTTDVDKGGPCSFCKGGGQFGPPKVPA